MYEIDLNWRDSFPHVMSSKVNAYHIFDEDGHIGFVAFEWLEFGSVNAHLEFDRFDLAVARQVRKHWGEFKDKLVEDGMVRLCACIEDGKEDVDKWQKFLRILKLEPPRLYHVSITEV